jgi:hypothetical protein
VRCGKASANSSNVVRSRRISDAELMDAFDLAAACRRELVAQHRDARGDRGARQGGDGTSGDSDGRAARRPATPQLRCRRATRSAAGRRRAAASRLRCR